MVYVNNGPHEDKLSVLAGMTVGNAMEWIKENFYTTLHKDATYMVNDEEVEDDYVLSENDTLEIIKPSGDKSNKA